MGLTDINTIEEVANYLRISTRTVRNLIKEGKIKQIKYLGSTRITRQSVLDFINL